MNLMVTVFIQEPSCSKSRDTGTNDSDPHGGGNDKADQLYLLLGLKSNFERRWRVFINHKQEQWPDWLEIVEFMYNNKIHMVTKILLFKVNYGQDPRMGFERRKKKKYKAAEKFIERIKKIQEEAKVVLGKAQEEMKKFANRK